MRRLLSTLRARLFPVEDPRGWLRVPETYRVKWTETVQHDGFVTDGDQDGDAWEGSKEAAEALILKKRATDPTCTYDVPLRAGAEPCRYLSS